MAAKRKGLMIVLISSKLLALSSFCRIFALESFFNVIQMVKHLYIIAGCNGAGKTTASKTILPKSLLVKEFITSPCL